VRGAECSRGLSGLIEAVAGLNRHSHGVASSSQPGRYRFSGEGIAITFLHPRSVASCGKLRDAAATGLEGSVGAEAFGV
jgi:hypothetical protein